MKSLVPIPFKMIRALLLVLPVLTLFFLPEGRGQNALNQEITIIDLDDSVQVMQDIEASRAIHKKAHNETEEYALAERAVEVSLRIGDTLLYAQALDNIGLLHRYHQRYQEAITYHTKALEVSKLVKTTPLNQMIFANNAGVASRYAQEYDKAVLYYMQALKIAEQEQDLKNIAISCNGLGNTLIYIKNREEDALAYFKRSLDAERQRGNTLGVAMNYLSISDYYNEKKDYVAAREYLNQLLAINTERKDDFGLAITYEFFGWNYLKEGIDLSKATLYSLKSLELYRQLNNTHKQADVLKQLGDINKEKQQYSPAIAYYTQAIDLANQINNKGLLMGVYNDLAEIYEKQSELKKALESFKISQLYKDSVALMEQETQIAAIEKRYAIEKKENQIALLEKDRILDQTQLKSQSETLKGQKFMLLILMIGLFSIIIIAIMQYRNIRIKKKSNFLLKQQKDKIILQKEDIEKVNERLEEALDEIIDQQQKNEERRIKLLESKFENKIQSLNLQSLESQMNPHFLFNGMNAVRWLVVQNKNEQAMEYLNTFAQLLRLSLTNNRKNAIPLSEELKTTSLYLDIEKLRFNSEFNFHINISPEIDADLVMVPPKILQPLAENAVKHGLLPSRKTDKELAINVFAQGDAISIVVLDNGMGIRKSFAKDAEPKMDGTHLGLKLIQERLVIYNKQNRNTIDFKIEPHRNESGQVTGTRAEIRIMGVLELEAAGTNMS